MPTHLCKHFEFLTAREGSLLTGLKPISSLLQRLDTCGTCFYPYTSGRATLVERKFKIDFNLEEKKIVNLVIFIVDNLNNNLAHL